MTNRLVIGNWKMNTTLREATALAEALARAVIPDNVEVGVAPPFPWLQPVATILGASSIQLGAQTCASQPNGAFTGEVSIAMLAELCDFVLVGHSERRATFAETDLVVREKLRRVLEGGLQPVLCVGETGDQRSSGLARSTVRTQLTDAFASLGEQNLEPLTIAYEPVWAIGTGNNATPADAAEMCSYIRTTVEDLTGQTIKVLYGGSVNAGSSPDLIGAGQIDGFLVGGASLKFDEFMTIIRAAAD